MNKKEQHEDFADRLWLHRVLNFDKVECQGRIYSPLDIIVPSADAIYHDQEAAWYDTYLVQEPVLSTENWLVPQIVKLMRPGIIVDIGCGTGRVAERLVNLGRKVIAVDHSIGMLQKTVTKINSDLLVPLYADARELPLQSASCDGVVCSGVLHHIQDWQQVLDEIARVLRPGGRLVIREPNADYAVNIFTSIETTLANLNRQLHHTHRQTPSQQAITKEYATAPYEQHISIEAFQNGLPESLHAEFVLSTMLFGSLALEADFPLRNLYYKGASLIDRWLFEHQFCNRSGALLFSLAIKELF